MACTCLNEVDARLSERNTRLMRTIVLRGEGGSFPTISVEKINPRGPKPVFMIPTYCPFCGAAYEPQPAVPAQPQEQA